MRYLRRVEQTIRRDKVRNQTIRMALNVKPLQSQIQQMLLRWFGHVVRMPESRYPRMALRLDTRVEEPEADLGPNGRTTSKMHCSRREWTGDRPDQGTRQKDMACSLPDLYT
jgi:hypothetical protein